MSKKHKTEATETYNNTISDSLVNMQNDNERHYQKAIRSKSKPTSQVEIDLTKSIKEMGNIDKLDPKEKQFKLRISNDSQEDTQKSARNQRMSNRRNIIKDESDPKEKQRINIDKKHDYKDRRKLVNEDSDKWQLTSENLIKMNLESKFTYLQSRKNSMGNICGYEFSLRKKKGREDSVNIHKRFNVND